MEVIQIKETPNVRAIKIRIEDESFAMTLYFFINFITKKLILPRIIPPAININMSNLTTVTIISLIGLTGFNSGFIANKNSKKTKTPNTILKPSSFDTLTK